MKAINYIFILLAAATFASCVTDEFVVKPTEENGDAMLSISTRAEGDLDDISNPDYLDYKVDKLRIMAFRDGTVRSNKFYNLTDTSLGEKIEYHINKGTYTFVFLANEPTDLTATLEKLQNRAALNSLSIEAKDITHTGLIPQIQEMQNVKVDDNMVEHPLINGGEPTDTWQLQLVRLAARIDIALYADLDLGADFKGVKLTGLTNRVPLFEEDYNGAEITRNVVREFTTTNNGECFANVSTEKLATEPLKSAVWTKQVVRLIVPFNEFTPTTDEDKAVGMTILLHDQYNPSATMGVADQDATKNFTLPRNNHLDCLGEVSTPLMLNISIEDWDDMAPDSDPTNLRILNVSEITTPRTLNNYKGEWMVSFFSNQPDVKIEPTGTWTSSDGGTGTFDVEDYWDIDTLNHDASTGKGTVTFKLRDLPSAPRGLVKQKIVLRAGNDAVTDSGDLRRELTLSVNYLVYAPPGVVGITKSGKLTLKGSSTYSGTPEVVATATEFGGLEGEPVYVVYYKWGSTIATIGGDNVVNDIVWAPDGYKGTSGIEAAVNKVCTEIEVGADAVAQWALIPYGDLDGHDGKGPQIWPETNPATGLGDPCTLADKNTYSDVNFYVTPTGTIWNTGTGKYPFGQTNLSTSNPYFNRDIPMGISNGVGNWSANAVGVYLPAAGFRSRFSTAMTGVGSVTSYLMTTPVSDDTNTYGLTLNLGEKKVTVNAMQYLASGTPIRCAKPDPKPLAAPGMIGYIHNPGGSNHHKLTLNGSSEYDVTPFVESVGGNSHATGKPVEKETVYAAYFQFGSLVAVGSNEGNSDTFTDADIIQRPTGLGTFTYWDDIPNAGDAGLSIGNGANITELLSGKESSGIGDPCAYWGKESGWEGSWQMQAYNTTQYTVTNLEWHGQEDLGLGIPAGRLSLKNGETGWYYPAAGMRHVGYNGIVLGQNTDGLYWYSTADNTGYGKSFGFNAQSVAPSVESYGDGMTVRCVKASATLKVTPNPVYIGYDSGATAKITVTTNQPSWSYTNKPEWLNVDTSNGVLTVNQTNTGTSERSSQLTITAGSKSTIITVIQAPAPQTPAGNIVAPPGVLGYTAGTRKLTLKGSREYAGTPLEANSQFGSVSNETVYVAYFKYGSLIALSSEANNTSFDDTDIVWAPIGYKNTLTNSDALVQAKVDINSWNGTSGVPYRASAGWPDAVASGHGDPCKYAEGGGSEWHVPSKSEMSFFYQGTTSWRTKASTGYPYSDGRVLGSTTSPDWNWFLSATGSRNSNSGVIDNSLTAGFNFGFYWLNSLSGGGSGENINFGSGSISAGISTPSAGNAIRCMK